MSQILQLRGVEIGGEGEFGALGGVLHLHPRGFQPVADGVGAGEIAALLGGRALIQAITVQDHYFDLYRKSSDYIRQYTFPGGMLLSDAVIADQARQAGLVVKDNYAFGQDYAQTCRMWADRLRAKSEQVFGLGYDQSFLRSWLFYLEICAASFSVGHTNVVQVELAHAK